MQMRTATVRGLPMRWEERGEGFPVVFVHGIPTGPALWRHVLPRLPEARCLAWEMAGYAGSMATGGDRGIGVADQAGYLLDWLDALGIERAVLVGHDLGGGVVQILATKAPQRCAGLVLANSIAYDSWPIPSIRAMRAAGALTERLPDRLFKPVFAALLHLGHDDRDMARESLAIHWAPYEQAGAAAAMLRQIRALDTRDTIRVQDELTGLDVPAQVVWGAADRYQKVRYGERLAAALGTRLHRIEGGRHWVPEDHPDVVAAAVANVLSAVTATSPRER